MTTNNPNTTVYSINFGEYGIYTPEQISSMKAAFEELIADAGYDITNIDEDTLYPSFPGTTVSSFPGTTASSFPGTTVSSFPGTTESSFPGTTESSFPGTTVSSFPGTTVSSFPGTTVSSFPGTTVSSFPSTTPFFNFSVDVIANEIARGQNIIQWKIIENELTSERIDAIKNIIYETINNS